MNSFFSDAQFFYNLSAFEQEHSSSTEPVGPNPTTIRNILRYSRAVEVSNSTLGPLVHMNN